MPNILIYAPIIGRGGVHRMITRLIEHWQHEKDWRFIMLSQTADEIGEPIDWQGVEFIQIDGGVPPKHPALFKWLQDRQQIFYAHWQKVAKEYSIDLTYFPMPWWTTRFERFSPVTPMVITLHDFAWDQLNIPMHEFRAEARLFSQHTSLTIFPSDYQRKWGEEYYGFKNSQTIHHGHFIPPGFLATPTEAARVHDIYGLPERYVLAFHCANSKKDPVTILRAHLAARKESPDIPPLVIAGLDTSWFIPNSIQPGHNAYGFAKHLWREMAEYTLHQDLFVLGDIPIRDMGGLYAGSKVVVSASLNEGGVNGTMFEAFAAHVPCIYTNLLVFSERLKVGDYGFTFQPGDVDGLKQALISVCTDEKQTAKMTQKAFKFANSRTWADAAIAYLEAFKGVLS